MVGKEIIDNKNFYAKKNYRRKINLLQLKEMLNKPL